MHVLYMCAAAQQDLDQAQEGLLKDMSSRKAKQDVKAGLKDMEGMVDQLIERHLISNKN